MQLKEVIQRQRHRLRLTQEELGAAVGCTRSTIASYEAGNIMPSLAVAKKLAALFGITLDALTQENGTAAAAKEPAAPTAP
jgi:DNA-binding XRE family transcriptional regulator